MARPFAKTKAEKEAEKESSTPKRQMTPSSKLLTPQQVYTQLEEMRRRNKLYYVPPHIGHWFPFGIPPLDYAINQGLPGGRLAEFSGPERSGKSTLAAKLIAQAQEAGGRGDYFDLEVGTTPGQLSQMGRLVVDDPLKFGYYVPESAEQCFQLMEDTIPIVGSSGLPSVLVLDSVPGLISIVELMSDYVNETQLAMEARLLKKFCRKNMVVLSRFPNVIVVFINHLNTPFKVGMFDRPEPYTSGGKSPRYYSTVRLRFDGSGERETVPGKSGDKVVVRENPRIFLWKNRVGAALRSVKVPINFLNDKETATTKGFDTARCCLEFLKEEKVLVHPQTEDPVTGKVTTSTSYWKLDGVEGPNRYMKDWVRLYNTDEKTREDVNAMCLLAAQAKWAPDEDLEAEADCDYEPDLSDLSEMGVTQDPIPA